MENELEIPEKWGFYHKAMYNKIIAQAPFEIIEESKKDIIWIINNYLSQDYLDDYIILQSNDCLEVYIKAAAKFYILYLKDGEEKKFCFCSIRSIKDIEINRKGNNCVEVKICMDVFAPKFTIQYSKDNKEASDFFAKLI